MVSGALLGELERALAYATLRSRIAADQAAALVSLLRETAIVGVDPEVVRRSEDPGDDHLLALGENERAVLVSGDRHLLVLAGDLPIETAHDFLDALEAR